MGSHNNEREDLLLEKQKKILLSEYSEEDIDFYNSILSEWANYNQAAPTVIQITTEAGTDGK